MARFNVNRLAGASDISGEVADQIAGGGFATTSDVSTAVSGLATTSAVNAVAADLLAGAGRPIEFAPDYFTGDGSEKSAPVPMPSGFTVPNGSKAKISGTILVRSNTGNRLAEIAVRDLIVQRSNLGAWDSVTAAALGYDTGARVANEGHGWVSTVDNNTDEPTVASHTGWTDLGGPITYVLDEVRAPDVTPILEAAAGDYFADPSDLPTFGANLDGLALFFLPINGQTIKVEFDGTAADIGVN